MCHTLDYDGGLKSTITAEGTCAAEQSGGTSGGPLAQQISSIQADIASFKSLYAENVQAQRLVIGGVQGQLDEVRDEVTILLHIGSSRGTAFKNNAVSTVLTVTVYRGSQTITDITALREALGDTAALNWSFQRFSSDTVYTIDPADTRISEDGFCFTVSPDDDVKK